MTGACGRVAARLRPVLGCYVGFTCAVLAVPALPVVPSASRAARSGHVAVVGLSGRADLISGGEASWRCSFRVAHAPSRLRVVLERRVRITRRGRTRTLIRRRDVTHAFALRANRYEGLVTGLKPGRNVLVAVLRGGRAARVTITNHPNGGPVFSGPQVQPYTCEAGAVDANCDKPAVFSYLYESTDPTKNGLQPYDPAHPPSDVALTTTDQGVRVPFIVREEVGYDNCDQYTILTAFQPGKPWAPVVPAAPLEPHAPIAWASPASKMTQPTPS